ncbi:Two component system response regulator/histidine kinase [Desulfonema limicola]|uniref:Sensory/regulatory protein RpfC n=1 Tax=Desulfonema limicola TaxID=45656 RepID=A0A975GIY0_9BACT|nr:hybrid sensor histidine kinase/response regulator [Desulfonema limicola]QTA82393.1 Two component system response regulator/histidine kinase [Desulfonema limicola]
MEICIPNYHTVTQLYESSNSPVYRAVRDVDQQPVILKLLREAYPSPERIARFKREYEVTRNIKLDVVPDMYALNHQENRWIMEMEDFGGHALELSGAAGKLDGPDFLRLAVTITDIIGQIHHQRIIHKDISPANIVWNKNTGQVKVIDFGISTVLERENQTFRNPNVLEGSLAYISPEQTGRMNRSVDYRTDFYSLGVTLYELLTGQLPFQHDDPLELVHCHIAGQPVPPIERIDNSQLSIINYPLSIISAVIMKLMAKNAEDRYQSAFGLKADLELCARFMTGSQALSGFRIGQQDMSDRFTIPQKLYGRRQETGELLRLFDEAANGTKRFITVTGAPGVGKSALVQEVHKPITAKRGNFIAGKFEQYQRNVPYFALTQAFNQLCDHLLQERSDSFAAWKQTILEAVGQNGQVLIEVIPGLEHVIGPQPDIPQAGPQESQARFNLYVQYFIRAVSRPEHPLVIFIDDLQWADFASLNLIKLLMSDTQSKNLLIIGAYRDNEVDAGHPLLMILSDIKKTQTDVYRIHLDSLKADSILELTGDCVHGDAEKTGSLAELVYEKTLGNAFFTIQFLTGLYEDGLLTFSEKTGWTWDINKIRLQAVTDNVIFFMTGKIRKLPYETQNILTLAACAGSRFDVSVLAAVSEKPLETVIRHVLNAAQEGMVIPLDSRYFLLAASHDMIADAGNFRFVHDRIQQAAYTLIPEAEKQAVHLQIGRILLARVRTSPVFDMPEMSPVPEDQLFEITNQLNCGIDLLTDAAERLELAHLNLRAGIKAKKSLAYRDALYFIQTGIDLLPPDSWNSLYELTLELYQELHECYFLTADFEKSDQIFDLIVQNVRNKIDAVKSYINKINRESMQGSYAQAVHAGFDILSELGLHLSEENLIETLQQETNQIETALFGKSVPDLSNMPEAISPDIVAASKIFSVLMPAAFFYNPNLNFLIVFKTINMALAHGICGSMVFPFACSAMPFAALFNDYARSYDFGCFAIELAKKYHDKYGLGNALHVFALFTQHWKDSLRKNIPVAREAFLNLAECGDLQMAGCSWYEILDSLYGYGENLDQILEETDKCIQYLEKTKNHHALGSLIIYKQVCLCLKNQTADPGSFDTETYSEAGHLENISGNMMACCYYHIYKLHVLYLTGSYEAARSHADEAEKILPFITGFYPVSVWNFYASLNNCQMAEKAGFEEEKQGFLEKTGKNQEQMRAWAENAPMNFQHKYDLVEAELARVTGRHGEAREYYDKAISLAKEHEYIQEHALANELAGKFYLKKGLPRIAAVYFTEAHYGWRLWGAAAQVEQMEHHYSAFLQPKEAAELKASMKKTTTSSTTSTSLSALDMTSIIRASQAISGEIVLRVLLTRLMGVMLENAGAQKGLLVLAHDNDLYVEAQADMHTVSVFGHVPLSDAHDFVSPAIVNFVWRSRTPVVLNDAAHEGGFTADAYIAAARPKSVLCLPISGQGKCLGVLYMENNLVTCGFPQERTEILSILAAQAAISIENAQLYTTLEQKVADRTAELRDANSQLTAAKDTAEAATRAKSQFLASMSHELRTPLNAVINMTRLLLETRLDSEQKDFAETAVTASEMLLSLINDILDFSKIEAGKLELENTDFDLKTVIEAVVKIITPIARDKGIDLQLAVKPDIKRHLGGDPVRLRQILLNLMSNAVKFTHKGGIIVRVFEDNQTGNRVKLKFEVEDSGIGVPRDRLNALFQSFSQVDASTTRKYGGTGLGLAISKQLAELMEGQIGVDSMEGKGSRFWFTAVFELRSNDEFGDGDSIIDKQPLAHDQPYFGDILLVEDNALNQRVALAMLKKFSIAVDVADNGLEAVKALQKKEYDLVLMDMQMPEMDGVQAARIIRSQAPGSLNQGVPIVAMTANTRKEDRERCFEAGMEDYLTKPINPSELLAVIEKYFKNKKAVNLNSELPDSAAVRVQQSESSTLSSPVFDYQSFLNRIGGDESFIKSFISQVPANLSEKIEKLKHARDRKDTEKIIFYAHTIKGISANISAKKLTETACMAENAGKEGTTEIDSILERLEQEFEILLKTLKDMFPDIFTAPEKSCSDETSESISEEIQTRLPELILLLDNEIFPKWKKAVEEYSWDDHTDFNELMIKAAEEYPISFLISYTQELNSAVVTMNFDTIDKLTAKFPEMVDRIRKMALPSVSKL